MTDSNKKDLYEDLPETPGVYIMKDSNDEILYIGKAANLKKRVSSYFTGAHERRTEELIKKLSDIDYKTTDSALEALILEANLIKKHQPPFNVREKDDKSFLWVRIREDEKYPRVLLSRGSRKVANKGKGEWFGPFTNASDIRSALKTLRKIFPYNTHKPSEVGRAKRECMYAQIGLCPGTCVGDVEKQEYMENVESLKKVLSGERAELIDELKEKMKRASENKNFERAQKLKEQINALQHIRDVGMISESSITKFKGTRSPRIEGYDISNISGTSPVGAMVSFKDGKPDKKYYRKFKIRSFDKQNDVGMMKKVLERRLKHEEWPYPDLIVVDGGKAQINAVEDALSEFGLEIPTVGIAKGPDRDKNEFQGDEIPEWTDKQTLLKVRDEAHRFAQKYHKKVRSKRSGIE